MLFYNIFCIRIFFSLLFLFKNILLWINPWRNKRKQSWFLFDYFFSFLFVLPQKFRRDKHCLVVSIESSSIEAIIISILFYQPSYNCECVFPFLWAFCIIRQNIHSIFKHVTNNFTFIQHMFIKLQGKTKGSNINKTLIIVNRWMEYTLYRTERDFTNRFTSLIYIYIGSCPLFDYIFCFLFFTSLYSKSYNIKQEGVSLAQ